MTDSPEHQLPGRTHWRRFAALMIPATTLAAAVVFGMANGAVAASFAVSGQQFKVSAEELVGEGFVQYGGVAPGPGVPREKWDDPTDARNHVVAVSGIKDATLYKLCQSVRVPVPGMNVVLTINAGDNPDRKVVATDLMLDVTELQGDAHFEKIQIGRNAAELGPARPGSFGQSADKVTIRNLRQVAWSTTAGTFTLNDLKLKVNVGPQARECFGNPAGAQ